MINFIMAFSYVHTYIHYFGSIHPPHCPLFPLPFSLIPFSSQLETLLLLMVQ